MYWIKRVKTIKYLNGMKKSNQLTQPTNDEYESAYQMLNYDYCKEQHYAQCYDHK